MLVLGGIHSAVLGLGLGGGEGERGKLDRVLQHVGMSQRRDKSEVYAVYVECEKVRIRI